MRKVIVSSADIASQPGAPLSPAYWAGRRDGESYPEWKRRMDAAEHIAMAARYIRCAEAQLKRAKKLLEES